MLRTHRTITPPTFTPTSWEEPRPCGYGNNPSQQNLIWIGCVPIFLSHRLNIDGDILRQNSWPHSTPDNAATSSSIQS